jgi:uncharacterized protein
MTKTDHILSKLKDNKSSLAQFGVRNVGLFGSYVRGEQSNSSDIDILIEFDTEKENFDNYMSAFDLIEELFKNERVEIVTVNGLSPYIGPKILKEVKYV